MKPQKVKHLHIELEKKNPSIAEAYIITEKYDGWYGYVDVNDGYVSDVYSGNGRAIPSVRHLRSHISADLNPGVTGRLIFEILLDDIQDFTILNGRLNRTQNGYIEESAYLMLHDFVEKGRNLPAGSRMLQLRNNVFKQVGPKIVMAPHKVGDLSDARVLCDRVWARGGEGVILKDINGLYHEGKRNATLMKIKEDVTLDLLVIGLQEGQGKYRGTLGTLIVRDKAGNHHAISGMTDEDRYQWWSNPKAIVGKVVEVRAMKRLADGSLREPRFKAVRYNKDAHEVD